MSRANLDDFIQQKIAEIVPPPLVVSDTAIKQLRPVFAQLLAHHELLRDCKPFVDAQSCFYEQARAVKVRVDAAIGDI